jgi:hypothetical protein
MILIEEIKGVNPMLRSWINYYGERQMPRYEFQVESRVRENFTHVFGAARQRKLM